MGCPDDFLCKHPELFMISFAKNRLVAQSLPNFAIIQPNLS